MTNHRASPDSGGPLENFHREGAISVVAVQGGWRLDASVCGQALMFLSGACAERQARALARRLAGLGYDMRVEVRDRSNAVAGSFRYPAAPPACESMDAAFEARSRAPL